MNLNKVKLKVKALSLAEEARIIKRLEKGCENDWGFNPIYDHRVKNVRNEARATNLARAFLSGKAYSRAENSRKPEKEYNFNYIKKRLIKIVSNYGYVGDNAESTIEAWLKE
jgi:hypothetical protein